MYYFNKTNIYKIILLITLIFGVFGMYWPYFLQKIQYPLSGILVVLIGLPHGATDFLLFRRLYGPELSRKKVFKFFLFYLVAIFGYLSLWLLFPTVAMITFLVISAYHFGQSNCQTLPFSSNIRPLINVSFGAFTIGGSVLWHWDEAQNIVQQMIGSLPACSDPTMANIQWFILLFNVVIFFVTRIIGQIDTTMLIHELVKLCVLSFMFYFTPLLVGFSLYFVLWHSLSSLFDQILFFRNKWPSFTLTNYYYQAAPYTLLAILGLLGLMFGQSVIFPNTSFISLFLILIACVTLPHIILVEERYK